MENICELNKTDFQGRSHCPIHFRELAITSGKERNEDENGFKNNITFVA